MKQATVDISKRLDIICRRSNTFSKIFSVKNADGTPFNFTGYTAKLEVFSSVSDRTPDLVFNAANGLTLSLGEIYLSKLATQMNMRRRDYIYFLTLTYPDGSIKVWLNGSFIVNEGFFDGITETEQLQIELNGQAITLNIEGAASSNLTGVPIYRSAYNASSGLFPTSGGTGIGGAIQAFNIFPIIGSGTLAGENIASIFSVMALENNPGQDVTKWKLNF